MEKTPLRNFEIFLSHSAKPVPKVACWLAHGRVEFFVKVKMISLGIMKVMAFSAWSFLSYRKVECGR